MFTERKGQIFYIGYGLNNQKQKYRTSDYTEFINNVEKVLKERPYGVVIKSAADNAVQTPYRDPEKSLNTIKDYLNNISEKIDYYNIPALTSCGLVNSKHLIAMDIVYTNDIIENNIKVWNFYQFNVQLMNSYTDKLKESLAELKEFLFAKIYHNKNYKDMIPEIKRKAMLFKIQHTKDELTSFQLTSINEYYNNLLLPTEY